jgi:predicted ATPase
VYFVPLTPLSSSDHIVSAIAQAVGFQFPPDHRSPLQQLSEFLKRKALLLVLDNFEHVLEGATLVVELLGAATAVKAVVTSRERLQVTSERVFALAGMTVPAGERLKETTATSSVQLFLWHSRRLTPNFTLTEDDFEALTRLCRLLGGMPLALLMAASWVELLPIQAIASAIAPSLDLLETELRDLPQRQRSMRAVFDASWERLTGMERLAFMKLSIFRGGFSASAAQAVAGATLKTLYKLVQGSWVQVIGEARYDIHELM